MSHDDFQPPEFDAPDLDECPERGMFEERVYRQCASMLSCDASGTPVDAYIPRWKAQSIAAEADAVIEELVCVLQASLVYMKYPRDASSAFVVAHNIAIDRAKRAIVAAGYDT